MPKYGVYGAGVNGLRYGVFDTDALTWTGRGYVGAYSAIYISNDNRFLFAKSGASLVTFTIDPVSLMPVLGFSTAIGSAFTLTLTHPTTPNLYGLTPATGGAGSSIVRVPYGATGVPSAAVTAATTPVGTSLNTLSASADGRFLYAFSLGNTYYCYGVGADGSLTLTASGGLGPLGDGTFGPPGAIGTAFGYAGSIDNSLPTSAGEAYQYAVSPVTGALTALTPAFVATLNPVTTVLLSPMRTFLLAAGGPLNGTTTHGASVLTVGDSGSLTLTTTLAPPGASTVYITPDERMLYIGDTFYSKSGTVFTNVGGSPTLASPTSVVGFLAPVSSPVIGCMNPAAQNYNPLATVDTTPSSCLFTPGGGGGTGTGGDGYGNGCRNVISYTLPAGTTATIRRATDAAITQNVVTLATGYTGASYTDTTITTAQNGVTLYYQVTAVSAAGGGTPLVIGVASSCPLRFDNCHPAREATVCSVPSFEPTVCQVPGYVSD